MEKRKADLVQGFGKSNERRNVVLRSEKRSVDNKVEFIAREHRNGKLENMKLFENSWALDIRTVSNF